MGYKLENLIGHKFNRLTVIGIIDSKQYGKYKKRRWKCICDCGNEIDTITQNLKRGHTKSCGCLHKEQSALNGINSRHKIIKKIAGFNGVYSTYRSNAKMRNYEFSISREEFIELIKQNCFYCGSEPSSIYDKFNYDIKYTGIDRIDNKLGYTLENVVPCCKLCNIAKNKHSLSDFIDWIDRLSNNINKNRAAINKLKNGTQRLTYHQEANQRTTEQDSSCGETNDLRASL